MTPRWIWFAGGAAAGVWATLKARRAAYRLTPPGLIDQAGALGAGLRAFNQEVRDGMRIRESQLTDTLELRPEDDH